MKRGVVSAHLERDFIILALHQECPVVVTIAASRVASSPIELGVGDANSLGTFVAGSYHLSTDTRDLLTSLSAGVMIANFKEIYLDMIDPDQIAINVESVTTPDILGVKLRNMNVLDDDI